MLCPLHRSRNKAITGDGNRQAGMLIIGQAPGKIEDQTGKMFQGPSGKLFYELVRQAGLTNNDFYMTNLVKCYLPRSKRPSSVELKACTPFLLREMQLLKGDCLVPLGFHATRFLFTHFNLPKPPKSEYHLLFGKVITAGQYSIYPLRHPTALLFNPEKRDLMERNYKFLKQLA